jgi:tetraacyldisaccharide 4'-kinase
MFTINWPALHQKKAGIFITILLYPLSLVYGCAIQLWLFAYKQGLLKTKFLPAFVVSVGNITTGGTGKTPFVAMLSEWAAHRGLRTAILSRGYKRKSKRKPLIVSDGKGQILSAYDAGDEPILLAKKLPSTPVLVSKDRYAIGVMALRLFSSELLLLDDGYQHISLKRDLNILLIDEKRQFGNGLLLPMGPLREPFAGISRADLIVISGCSEQGRRDNLVELIRETAPAKPILHSRHLPDKILFPQTGEVHSPHILAGKNVIAFAGIAYSDDFLEMITGLGAQVVEFTGYPDHHAYNDSDLKALGALSRRSDIDFLLTTEKDWVRIEEAVGCDINIAVLTIKIELLEDSHTFFDIIERGIQGLRGLSNEG